MSGQPTSTSTSAGRCGSGRRASALAWSDSVAQRCGEVGGLAVLDVPVAPAAASRVRLVALDEPRLVEQRPHGAPARLVEQQVVALGDHQPVLGAYGDRAGHRLLAGPVELRGVDRVRRSRSRSRRSSATYPADVEGLRRALAPARARAGRARRRAGGSRPAGRRRRSRGRRRPPAAAASVGLAGAGCARRSRAPRGRSAPSARVPGRAVQRGHGGHAPGTTTA